MADNRRNNRYTEAKKAEIRESIRYNEEMRIKEEREERERQQKKAMENTTANFPTLSNAPVKAPTSVQFEGGNFAQKAAEWKVYDDIEKKIAAREAEMPAQPFYSARPNYKKKSSKRVDLMGDNFDVNVYRDEEETNSAPVDESELGWSTVETTKVRKHKPHFGGQIQMSVTVQARIQKRREILQRLERGEVLTWQDRKTLEEPIEDDEEFNADLAPTTKKNKNDERSKKNDIATT